VAKSKGRRGRYRMTPKRKAALHKAQIASARKRKGHGKAKTAAAVVGGVALIGGAAYARHRYSGSSFGVKTNSHLSAITGDVSGSRPASLRMTRQGRNRTIAFQTAKRGPLGKSKTYSYTHVPLRIGGSKAVAGRKIDRGLIPKYNPMARESWVHGRHPGPPEVNVNGGVKIGGRPGILVDYNPKDMQGAAIPSRVVGYGTYPAGALSDKYPARSRFNMAKRMAEISKRHGI
jgi:hypothetical protein